jgi:glycosyltransferase involved in cell wall biosynthesis
LLVAPVGDVPALTEALDRLMGDEGERTRMASRALEVRERYSMEKIIAMWDATFDGDSSLNEI